MAAKALTDPSKGVYGFVSRGLKNANIPVWTSWLLGQGLETIDASGKLLTDTPEAIWAAEYYRDLNKNYAPPGTIGFNWNECQTSFHAGARRHVARRHRLHRAGRGPESVARRRQGRLWRHPAGPQGASFGDLRGRAWHFRRLQEEAGGLVLHPMGDEQDKSAPLPQGGRRRSGAQFRLCRSRDRHLLEIRPAMVRLHPRIGEDRAAWPARDHPGAGVPRRVRRGAHQHAHRRRPRDGAQEGDRSLQRPSSRRARRRESPAKR